MSTCGTVNISLLRSDDFGSQASVEDMKLHATIADYQTDILIQDDGARVHAEIDGRGYALEVRESGAGGYMMMVEAAVFDCCIDGRPNSGEPVDVVVGAT